MMIFRTHDRYIGSRFLGAFLGSLLVFSVLTGAYILISEARTFIENRVAFRIVISYVLNSLAPFLSLLFPFVAVSGALFSLHQMKSRGEIMPLFSGGVPVWRVGMPVLLLGLILSVGLGVWNEWVVPLASARVRFLTEEELDREEGPRHFPHGVWFHARPGFFVHAREVDGKMDLFTAVTAFEADRMGSIERMIESPSARWSEDLWTFREPYIRRFRKGEMVHFETSPELQVGGLLNTSPVQDLQPWEMSFRELSRRVKVIEAAGERSTRLLPDLHAKTSVPMIVLILLVCAVALVFRVEGGGFASNLGILVGVGLLYYGTLALLLILSRSGLVAAPVAAWLPNGLTLLLAGYLMRRAHRV